MDQITVVINTTKSDNYYLVSCNYGIFVKISKTNNLEKLIETFKSDKTVKSVIVNGGN